jgi:hypothetical protein
MLAATATAGGRFRVLGFLKKPLKPPASVRRGPTQCLAGCGAGCGGGCPGDRRWRRVQWATGARQQLVGSRGGGGDGPCVWPLWPWVSRRTRGQAFVDQPCGTETGAERRPR